MEDYVAAAVEVANFVAVVIILVRAAFLDSKFRAIATCAAVHQRELYLILGVANSATTPSLKKYCQTRVIFHPSIRFFNFRNFIIYEDPCLSSRIFDFSTNTVFVFVVASDFVTLYCIWIKIKLAIYQILVKIIRYLQARLAYLRNNNNRKNLRNLLFRLSSGFKQIFFSKLNPSIPERRTENPQRRNFSYFSLIFWGNFELCFRS